MSLVQTLSGHPHVGDRDTGPSVREMLVPPYADIALQRDAERRAGAGFTSALRINGDGSKRHADAAAEDAAARVLVHSLVGGNKRAFWELWAIYKVHLYRICLSHMDGVREDAEDALSRAMLRALDKLPRIGPRIENIRGWLSRLTVNLCTDMHREGRRRAQRLEQIDDVLPSLGESLLADADSPEEMFLSREAYACMCHAVNDLPERLREPFALRFFQEMAYVDIADRLILSNENVRKRIQQARDILKQRLNVPAGTDGLPAWSRSTVRGA